LGFVEIGALSVGKIVQIHDPALPFKRGAEKSVFRFGGSAVVMFGEPRVWKPSDDILHRTSVGIETFVTLGDEIGRKAI